MTRLDKLILATGLIILTTGALLAASSQVRTKLTDTLIWAWDKAEAK